MSRSALIKETKEDVSITDEDIKNEPGVDIGQVDPVSIIDKHIAGNYSCWSLHVIAGWVSMIYI